MLLYKCKKSVFCIYFLLFFFLGTISGVFLFRCLFHSLAGSSCWCLNLEFAAFRWNDLRLLSSAVRSITILAIFALVPYGYVFVPFLVFCRGFLMCYCFSQMWVSGAVIGSVFVKELLLLPLYYSFCRWVYFKWS